MIWSDATRYLVATSLTIGYLILCGYIYLAQRRQRQQAQRDTAALIPAAGDVSAWLIAYASQTGFAEQLAWQTARALHTAGVSAKVSSLSELGAADLQRAERALFIVSTYGEGDPPDNASLFAGKLMQSHLPLSHLHIGMLMLGDRSYKNFCGFGRALDAWLQVCGAQSMFDSIALDNADHVALDEWQHHLAREAGTRDLPDWQAPSFHSWRLTARRLLNPDSVGAPVFHIELQAMDGASTWEAGDLIQVLAPADSQRPREYSIASIPTDGRVHLLVRQERHHDGSLGMASGWLTEGAPIGATINARLRQHSNFRINGNAQRPLILIGNGTGLAGLRSHLKARATNAGDTRNWLIFGERNAAHDCYYNDEIENWRTHDVLQRVDLVYSRDQKEKNYVQDVLRNNADTVRRWLDDDAALYVCGSLTGMAGGVEAALNDIIGIAAVEQLVAQGRYRRDVY